MKYDKKKYVDLAGINEIKNYLQLNLTSIQDQAKQGFLS